MLPRLPRTFENVFLAVVIALVLFVATSFIPWYPSKVDYLNAQKTGGRPTKSVPLGSGYGDDLFPNPNWRTTLIWHMCLSLVGGVVATCCGRWFETRVRRKRLSSTTKFAQPLNQK